MLNTNFENTISVIVPSLNEAKKLKQTIEMLLELKSSWNQFEIIIIDDGSTDETPAICEELISKYENIKVITHSTPHGRGYSINEGFLAAKNSNIICVNGKKDTTEAELKKIFDKKGQADLIISYQANTFERPFIRRVLSKLYTCILNTSFGHDLKYYNGSILLRKSLYQELSIKTNSYALEAEMLIHLLHKNYSYCEVAVVDIFEQTRKTRALTFSNILGVFGTYLRLLKMVKVNNL